MSEWSVAEPKKLTFDEPVSDLHVRIVNGTVNVVGTDEGSARLEISEIDGPPLVVTQKSGTLTVAYEDLPWKGFLKWLDRKGWRRSAVVSLAVPASTRVEVGVVGAAAVVSGISGPSVVRGVTGDTTLVSLSGSGPRRDGLGEPGGPGRHRRPPLQLRLRRPHRRRGLGPLRARRVGQRLHDRGPRPGRPDRRPADQRLGRDRHPAAASGGRGRRGEHGERFDLQRLRRAAGARPVGRPQDHRRLGAGTEAAATTVSGSIASCAARRRTRTRDEDGPWDGDTEVTVSARRADKTPRPDMEGAGTGPERAGARGQWDRPTRGRGDGVGQEKTSQGPEHVGPPRVPLRTA
jgi:hypothetical protein